MSPQDLKDLLSAVKDLRFIQAAALVAAGLNEDKRAAAYMRRLAKLDKALTDEITRITPPPFSGVESTGHHQEQSCRSTNKTA